MYGESKTKPWEHQEQGYELAMKLRGVGIWFDMGCGKTKLAVDLVHNLKAKKTLVVCPKKAIDSVWPEEFKIHCANENMRVLALSGSQPSKKKATMLWEFLNSAKGERSTVVINYDSVWRGDLGKLISETEWDVIVADEAHRIKGHNAKSSKFMSKLKAKKKIGLSGTPFPHSPLDAFGIMRFLDPSVFGMYWTHFRARYAVLGGPHMQWVKSYKNVEELTEKVQKVSIYVKSEDVQDLPEFVDIPLFYTMNKAQAKAYNDFEEEMVAEVDGGLMTASNALVKALRLQQLASGFAVDDDDIITDLSNGKGELLIELLDGIPDEPVVVFCQFREDLRRISIAAEKSGREYYEISGSSSQELEWKEAIKRVKTGNADTDKKMPLPLVGVQIQSGGEAINLTVARYCVYWTTGVSLGKYAQSRKRVHRPGQKHKVFYYTLAAKGTIEESIARAMKKRKRLIDGILERMGPEFANLIQSKMD